jgi:uncharacterized protein
MATKQIWLNLPVKDVNQSKVFFESLGFTFNSKNGDTPVSKCMLVGDHHIAIMLFEENTFKSFTRNELCDTNKGTEILISIDAENPEEVDILADKAEKAGGIVFGKPDWNQGWMYGCGFSDLDGHRWNVLYMDLSKLPQ